MMKTWKHWEKAWWAYCRTTMAKVGIFCCYSVFTLRDTETYTDTDKKSVVLDCLELFTMHGYSWHHKIPIVLFIGFCLSLGIGFYQCEWTISLKTIFSFTDSKPPNILIWPILQMMKKRNLWWRKRGKRITAKKGKKKKLKVRRAEKDEGGQGDAAE